MLINGTKEFCYRICHINNLPHILREGLCNKHHPKADPHYIPIGNPSIISTRSAFPVKIPGYGNIGDYVSFYFTPRSMMLYNIVSGYYAPLVPKVLPEDIIIFRCEVKTLAALPRFFFTDGQANAAITKHYDDLRDLGEVDWFNIQHGNFGKANGDFDRPRRYQAEFLVDQHVPLPAIESVFVYNAKAAIFVNKAAALLSISLKATIKQLYYFI